MMAAKYWLKLYHEMLDDPKMILLSDRLYRRTIELFLLAGKLDSDGIMPNIKHMAVYLRLGHEELETDLVELAETGIMSQVDGVWIVTKFAERQTAVSDAERMKRYRDRKQLQSGDGDVTNRNADTDKESDKESDDIDYFGSLGKAFTNASKVTMYNNAQ